MLIYYKKKMLQNNILTENKILMSLKSFENDARYERTT